MPETEETIDAVIRAARAIATNPVIGRPCPTSLDGKLIAALAALDAPERDEAPVAVPRWVVIEAIFALTEASQVRRDGAANGGAEAGDLAVAAEYEAACTLLKSGSLPVGTSVESEVSRRTHFAEKRDAAAGLTSR